MTESPLESLSKIYRELILYALAGKRGGLMVSAMYSRVKAIIDITEVLVWAEFL